MSLPCVNSPDICSARPHVHLACIGSEVERPTDGGWKLDAETTWRETGALMEGDPYGNHMLHLAAVPGWTSPQSTALNVSPEAPQQLFSLRYARIPESYMEWQARVFGANAGNSAISGELADPDLDDSANLVEYATGSEALSPKSSEVLTVQYGTGNPPTLLFNFGRNLKAAPDIIIALEESNFLTDWSPVISDSRSEVRIAEHLSRVTLFVPRDQQRMFYRLTVSKL